MSLCAAAPPAEEEPVQSRKAESPRRESVTWIGRSFVNRLIFARSSTFRPLEGVFSPIVGPAPRERARRRQLTSSIYGLGSNLRLKALTGMENVRAVDRFSRPPFVKMTSGRVSMSFDPRADTFPLSQQRL